MFDRYDFPSSEPGGTNGKAASRAGVGERADQRLELCEARGGSEKRCYRLVLLVVIGCPRSSGLALPTSGLGVVDRPETRVADGAENLGLPIRRPQWHHGRAARGHEQQQGVVCQVARFDYTSSTDDAAGRWSDRGGGLQKVGEGRDAPPPQCVTPSWVGKLSP
ncbi:hypothetical protein MAPG_07142 [Magnaporthiopsis poae ATCC 64411]|uniref:Uncharacterized protein n=1 Tax=Magnaporthiopsis poae (strain ATCC 64411 / 73-15) TaxID=644358 RepID=A0A0C4E3W6_MAGP6|nr:hypothetical protein MAPG_07142 [Magnaporthiopsis poae ATCC 64411]